MLGSLVIVLLAYKCSPDSGSEISLKIVQYLTTLRRTKQSVPVVLATLYMTKILNQNLKMEKMRLKKFLHDFDFKGVAKEWIS